MLGERKFRRSHRFNDIKFCRHFGRRFLNHGADQSKTNETQRILLLWHQPTLIEISPLLIFWLPGSYNFPSSQWIALINVFQSKAQGVDGFHNFPLAQLFIRLSETKQILVWDGFYLPAAREWQRQEEAKPSPEKQIFWLMINDSYIGDEEWNSNAKSVWLTAAHNLIWNQEEWKMFWHRKFKLYCIPEGKGHPLGWSLSWKV